MHVNEAPLSLSQRDSSVYRGIAAQWSFSCWLIGLFSVGFTDIPYCDCLGGKSIWKSNNMHDETAMYITMEKEHSI